MVAGGGFVIYVQVGMGKYCPGPYISEWHKITGSIVMFLCYYSFYKACTVDPGVIQDKKESKIAKRMYPYDEVMYIKENECETCQIEKPARSKHCSVCGHCV